MSDFDIRIGDLLRTWAPTLGRPSCGPGCDRCCRRMSVVMTSAEALRLVRGLRQRSDFPSLRTAIAAKVAKLRAALPAPPDQALDALLDLGSCVFLDRGECGVYETRPDGCRSVYVWHEAWYCGRPEYDQCVPAELIEARIAEAFRLTLAEMDAGRTPYWGQILPAVWLMLEREEDYLAGADLASSLDPAWIASELIELPSRESVVLQQAEHQAAFQNEAHPFGAPRASECRSREDLAVFRID